MACVISIRGCPVPNDFFDGLIPEKGLEVQGWRLFLRRESSPQDSEGQGESFVDICWLFAEFDCDFEEIQGVLEIQRPKLEKILRSLTGMRSMFFKENLRFSMYFEEYVNNGVRGNINPDKISIGITVLNVCVKDGAGDVVFDLKEFEAEQARDRRLAAKRDLEMKISRYARFMSDAHFMRALESYGLALGAEDDAIRHLYDIKEAAFKRFVNAATVLRVSHSQLSKFGKLFNDIPVHGGRHNGRHSNPLRHMTGREKTEALEFAHKLLDAFVDQLELGESTKS